MPQPRDDAALTEDEEPLEGGDLSLDFTPLDPEEAGLGEEAE